jgi:hypothetical protein
MTAFEASELKSHGLTCADFVVVLLLLKASSGRRGGSADSFGVSL